MRTFANTSLKGGSSDVSQGSDLEDLLARISIHCTSVADDSFHPLQQDCNAQSMHCCASLDLIWPRNERHGWSRTLFFHVEMLQSHGHRLQTCRTRMSFAERGQCPEATPFLMLCTEGIVPSRISVPASREEREPLMNHVPYLTLVRTAKSDGYYRL